MPQLLDQSPNLLDQSVLPQPDLSINVLLPDGTPHTMYRPASDKHLWFHNSNIPNLLAYGNRGGGKSLLLRMDAHMRAMSVPDVKLVLVRKTFPELQLSHLNDIQAEMQMLGGHWHDTKHIATYPNNSKLFFSHVSNEGFALNLLSAQFLAAYFDELSTIPWEFFVKLIASVRVLKGSGLTAVVRAATNPLGPSAAELMSYFVKKDVDPDEDDKYNPNDWDSIKIQLEDNPYLDKEQYAKKFSGMPEYLRKAWQDGDFSLENQLFNFVPQTREGVPYHVIPELPLMGGKPILFDRW